MDDDLMIEKKINFKNNTFVSVKSIQINIIWNHILNVIL